MPVGDALLTRSVVITTAGTDYPTGLVAPGGSEVDELDLTGGPSLSDPLAALVIVTAISGTNTKLTTSFEVSSDPAFSSPAGVTVIPALEITTTGAHLLGWLPPTSLRYGRFKIVSTSDTTAAATVYCMLTIGANSRNLLRV